MTPLLHAARKSKKHSASATPEPRRAAKTGSFASRGTSAANLHKITVGTDIVGAEGRER